MSEIKGKVFRYHKHSLEITDDSVIVRRHPTSDTSNESHRDVIEYVVKVSIPKRIKAIIVEKLNNKLIGHQSDLTIEVTSNSIAIFKKRIPKDLAKSWDKQVSDILFID